MSKKNVVQGWSSIRFQGAVIKAHMEFIKTIDPTYFVTFNFNRRLRTLNAQNSIKHFMNSAQREVLGARWYKKPECQRLALIAIPEHIETNLHYHGFLRAGTEVDDVNKWTEDVIHAVFPRKWKEVEKKGSINIQRIYDLDECVNYVKKEMWKKENTDSIFMYGTDKTRP